ncbi:outer membrane beta-barrel protein [Spirosoma aerophilum]
MRKKTANKILTGWYFFFSFFLVGLLSVCSAQVSSPDNTTQVKKSYSVSGQVRSLESQPIVAALVAVLRPDSSYIKTTLTDSTGHFILRDLAASQYVIQVSHLGQQRMNRSVRLSDSLQNATLNFTLVPAAIKLNEVSVREKRPIFEVLSDRIVLNIESNPVFAGGNALDALSLAPRVTVDPITKSAGIDGKSGLIVYQNGRQLYKSADEVITYLQNLPASSISRIEILTNPPAQYDAGSSGVILIFTKGLDLNGFNGELSLTAGVGRYFKSNASLSLSLQTKKIQGSFLYAPNYRPTYFSWRSQQQLTDASQSEQGFSRSQEFNRIDYVNHLVRTSWNWNIAKSASIGTVIQASQTAETDNPTSSIQYQLASKNSPVTQVDAVTQLKSTISNFALNLNARKEFRYPQTNLSADIDFAQYNNNSLSSATFTQNLPAFRAAEYVRVRYPNSVKIKTAKIDFSTPFLAKGQFQSGVKYSSITMSNLPTTEQYSPSFSPLEPLLSKSYRYQEQTSSAYSNFNYAWAHWSLQAGLRLEHTYYRGQSGPSTVISRDYTNLFPSLNLQYTTAKKYQYSASFNRRIVRPAFDLLNPAYIFYDPLTLYSGNPLLLPQLTTTVQATYSTPKRMNLTVVYSYSKNRIAEIIYRIDSSSATTLNYKINFDWEKRIAATYSVPVEITSSWQLLASVTGANSEFYSTFKDIPISTRQSTAIFRLSNTIKSKMWSANVNLTYRTRAVVGYMLYDPIWFLDLGVQRPLGPRATIKLAASDIFHSLLITNYGNYLNTNIIFHHKYESQRVLLTYAYRFGNAKAKTLKERSFGSDTEQERLGGDNKN